MDINEVKKQNNTIPFYMLRALAISSVFIIIKLLMTLFALAFYSSTVGEISEFPTWAIFLTVAIGDGFVLSSLFNFFTTYDKRVMKGYISHTYGLDKEPSLKTNAQYILKSREFKIETLTTLALLFFAQCFNGMFEFGQIFRDTGAPQLLIRIIPFFFIPPLVFLASFLSRSEVFRYWYYLERTAELKKLESVPRMMIKAILIFVLYIFVFPVSPMALGIPATLIAILWMLIDVFTIVGFVALLIIIPSLTTGIMILRALSIRKKLFKKLAAAAKYSGTTVSDIENPYKSLFNPKVQCRFTLNDGKKTYACRVIGTFWQRAPFFITTERHAYYRHRLGTKEHNVTVYSNVEYGFEGDGKKLLILNPVPRRIYAANDKYSEPAPIDEGMLSGVLRRTSNRKKEAARKIEPGDKVFEYTVYNSTSFVGAVDRGCLDRSNGMFE